METIRLQEKQVQIEKMRSFANQIRKYYQKAQPYDADGAIAAYGFGANLNPRGKQISHCFNITLQPNKEEVDGIDGLIEAYTNCINRVQLYGPTYFGEILQNASAKSMGICDQQSQT